MDAVALERMEAFAQSVLKLSGEMQTEFFETMTATGMMSAEEAEGLKKYVALYHMFTDQRHYNAVRACALEMYMNELK